TARLRHDTPPIRGTAGYHGERNGGGRCPLRWRTRIAIQCAKANVIRKIKLAAAPADATSGMTSTMTNTISPVTHTAVLGVWLRWLIRAIAAGSVRSRAIDIPTRDAANRFACNPDNIASTPATITSQYPAGPR